ncbi:MAG: DUF5667 domain-containing protein [ANME-2 cluster archaeon]|nr:DUF5667 domain-containing protein [ANME-2 cluster archaeon]MDF1530755.1 DUF5667 domain-containing protein [ANME-2 cluster archaeon]
MKLRIVSIIAMALMLFSVPAMAEDNETALTDPGTTPDSVLYFLDVASDNLALAMTLNHDEKIEKQLEIAEERLAEAKAMAEKGDVKAMKKAADRHGEILSKLKTDVKNIENGDSVGELEKEIKIKQKVDEHSNKIKVVKDGLKIDIKVKGNITAQQQEMIDSILESLEGQTGEVEIEIENEKSKTKIKIKTETGKDGDEVEDEIEDELGITEKQRKKALEEIRDTKNDLNKTLKKYDAMNVTPVNSTVNEIKDLLAQAQTAFDAGEYENAKELAEQADDLVDELKDDLKESDHYQSDDKDESDDEDESDDSDDEGDEDEYKNDDTNYSDDTKEDHEEKDDSSDDNS